MSFFDQFKTDYPELKIVVNRTYDLLELAKAAMVTSGTATLETALFTAFILLATFVLIAEDVLESAFVAEVIYTSSK